VLQVGRNRLVLIFFSGACPELLSKGITTKEKNTFVEPFNLRIYFENFPFQFGDIRININYNILEPNKKNKKNEAPSTPSALPKERVLTEGINKQLNMTTIVILLCIGLMAGILSGMVGIGGGIIIVPALVYFLSMSQHEAQGTSLTVLLLPVGFLAVYNYYNSGYVNVKFSFIIALTFIIGGFIGSKIAISIDQNVLKKTFGIFMLILSIKMIFWK